MLSHLRGESEHFQLDQLLAWFASGSNGGSVNNNNYNNNNNNVAAIASLMSSLSSSELATIEAAATAAAAANDNNNHQLIVTSNTLKFANVHLLDESEYYCGAGGQMAKPTRLHVLQAPKELRVHVGQFEQQQVASATSSILAQSMMQDSFVQLASIK